LTDQRIYFYSKINRDTLIGKSSKLVLDYSQIKTIRKENNTLFLPNMIRVIMKFKSQDNDPRTKVEDLQNEYIFTSFLHRDDCFNII